MFRICVMIDLESFSPGEKSRSLNTSTILAAVAENAVVFAHASKHHINFGCRLASPHSNLKFMEILKFALIYHSIKWYYVSSFSTSRLSLGHEWRDHGDPYHGSTTNNWAKDPLFQITKDSPEKRGLPRNCFHWRCCPKNMMIMETY